MMNRLKFLSGLALTLFLSSQVSTVQAQKGKKDKDKEKTETPAKKTDLADFTKKMVKTEGLFTVYRDTVKGNIYMALTPEQLNQEFIYFSQVTDGVMDAGFFRGSYRGSKIIKFERNYERVLIFGENTNYYFDEGNALSKAAGANVNRPVLASLEIKSKDDDSGTILIDGDAIFMSEDFQMIKPPTQTGDKPGLLGKLSKEKSRVESVRNYPENLDISTSYVYENPNPQTRGSDALTDARNVTIKYQHSLIQVPENNFQPRRDDARVGYFMTSVTDMTSFSTTPYRDMIHRWNLEKKDPNAALSEPVEPIVFWIENTTPQEFRPLIKEAGERWNVAFEKAGFKNAVVVNIQPDTATWDAGDIRYNVLRWTSSPQPPFGGYGPSFVNPRTGQILGADIMLEFSAVSRRLFRKDVFAKAGYSHDELFESEHGDHDPYLCSAGEVMNHNLMFGLSAMRVQNMQSAAEDKFVQETLYRLILHEIGHTLGLTHNMRASTLLSMEELNNKKIVAEKGLCSSVMEYPAINYPAMPELLTKYYDDSPGPYDLWAIEYGYAPATADAVAEEKRLQTLLARSSEHQLAYGNDGDDMRSSGKGIDPDINIYDLSSDPVAYGVDRIKLVNELMPSIIEKYSVDGSSFEEFRQAYLSLSGEYANQISVFTRQIGGVHINRALSGQNGNVAPPFTAVSAERQQAAMKALETYAFAPNAFETPELIYRHLQIQRRGFNQPGEGEDPKIHERFLEMQKNCLSHLLNDNVLQRVTDSQLYGNEYPLDAYMTDLTNAIFKKDAASNVNTMRQNLQVEYTNRLAEIVGDAKKYDHVARSMALHELKRIDKMMAAAPAASTLTVAHRGHVRQIVKNTIES